MPMIIRGIEVSDKDLNQRFQSTFIEILPIETGKVEVVYVRSFSNGILETTGRGFYCNGLTITNEFPELGAIEYNKTVHYLTRLPRRQWSRGFHKEVIHDFCRGEDRRFSSTLDLARANAVFYPQRTPLQEGFELIKTSKKLAFAYDREFWFSGNKKRVYLWYMDVPIGEYVDGIIFYNKQCLPLKQEVEDKFKNVFKRMF